MEGGGLTEDRVAGGSSLKNPEDGAADGAVSTVSRKNHREEPLYQRGPRIWTVNRGQWGDWGPGCWSPDTGSCSGEALGKVTDKNMGWENSRMAKSVSPDLRQPG